MSVSLNAEQLTYFSSFPFSCEFTCWSSTFALGNVSVSSSFVAAPVCVTESVYTTLHSEQYIKFTDSNQHSPFWMRAAESSWMFCPVALMLLRICWSCSWVKHTKLSFTVFSRTFDVSLEDLVFSSDWTLTTPMTLQRSVLLFSLLFRLPCSAWLTPPVSLHFLSLFHLSSSLGPCLEVDVAFSGLFFWGTWYEQKHYLDRI